MLNFKSVFTMVNKINRFGLDISWSTTVFVLNLAFADLLTFIVNLPIYPMLRRTHEWTYGIKMCILSMNIRYGIAYTNWMSVAMIAISRYLIVKETTVLDNLKYRVLMLFSTWFFGFGLLTSTNLKVPTTYGHNISYT